MALGHKTSVWQMTTVRDIGVKNDQNLNALFIAQFIDVKVGWFSQVHEKYLINKIVSNVFSF